MALLAGTKPGPGVLRINNLSCMPSGGPKQFWSAAFFTWQQPSNWRQRLNFRARNSSSTSRPAAPQAHLWNGTRGCFMPRLMSVIIGNCSATDTPLSGRISMSTLVLKASLPVAAVANPRPRSIDGKQPGVTIWRVIIASLASELRVPLLYLTPIAELHFSISRSPSTLITSRGSR
jgi:hypothetical protein